MKRFFCLLLALLLMGCCAQAQEEAPSALQIYQLLEESAWDAVYARLNDTMRSALRAEDLAALLPSLKAALGNIVRLGAEESSEKPPYAITRLPLHFEKGSVLFQVVWQEGQIAGLQYIPLAADPVPEAAGDETPEGLTEEDFPVGDPPLPGTLTLPAGLSSPLPTVVLVHGSGPNDRDESLGGTKMFRDLAQGLARRGIAVLRYDKRTLTYAQDYTAEDLKAFTVEEETIRDAAAAALLLRADPRVDAGRIFLTGHSMGAMLAPRTAKENPGLFAGIVLLSGTPRTLADIVLNQNQALVDALPAASRAAGKLQMAALRSSWDRIQKGSAENAMQKTLFNQPAYYFWEMAQYDTVDLLKALDIPALIINGGADFQVPDADGVDAWRSAGLPDSVRLSHYPALNHLLMAPDAPEDVRGTVREYDIACHVSEEILDEIAAFILN